MIFSAFLLLVKLVVKSMFIFSGLSFDKDVAFLEKFCGIVTTM